jgi:hypothetical protein
MEETMRASIHRLTWPIAAMMGVLVLAPRAHAEESDPATLAAALAKAPTSLEQSLRASEKSGKPISAKFEIEDGKLQLSIYTMTADAFSEVVVTPDTGSVIKTEKITDADDLKDATEQKAAMKKTSTTLTAAIEHALGQNVASRAVSIFPELQSGHPVATVTLLSNGRLTKVAEKLD